MSDNNDSIGVNFNWSQRRTDFTPDPQYQVRAFEPSPPLTAFGNLQYIEFMRMLETMWEAGHPEIPFRPYKDGEEYDPEQGYIIWSGVRKLPKDNNNKPRFHHRHKDEETGRVFTVSKQSFIHEVKFSAVHGDPWIAEELAEAWEDFMLEATPIVKRVGLEDIFYLGRNQDDIESRVGKDRAVRAIIYRIFTQKIFAVENAVLNDLYLRVVTMFDATPSAGQGIIEVFPES